ncbi:MAG TPA: hypothetical protein DCY48_00835 [Candidatus Magasanikbacteria bacterium]|nr:MAG: hypothetical protein A3I74_02415 [Candidatus Magasanikbacteria bacterium RIFCSPLOWO2_02_FULL_47_16]OGH79638.1 MAG: hypothetical protein A3C10_00985 [Candidatus Magasanikbacteria bacterium RIFCSPHIGHO2_02_FULL_48_18]OGH82342.1 MAG: hypothetical protein A3G08_03180 [Candidatus Magasanikbacteria bacterium RIFCSPLOWO2_12_FULL_47_9b]HAZ28306.1 hypothetical protein [Candidatus Magasanikbacteria bacterium]
MAQTTSFSKAFLDDMKNMLLTEKDRLTKELAKFTTKNPHVEGDFETTMPEYGSEEDDNAREVAEYTTNKPLELTLEKTLRDVVKALDRIDKGQYGMCKYCGQPIEEKRLRARPTSSSCIPCKKTITQEA